MAKMRSRTPSPKTRLGGTTWKKRLMQALGALMLVTALEKRQGTSAKGRQKNGMGTKLAEAFFLGTVLHKERQKSAFRGGHAHTPEKQQAARQEQPFPETELPPLQRRPSP